MFYWSSTASYNTIIELNWIIWEEWKDKGLTYDIVKTIFSTGAVNRIISIREDSGLEVEMVVSRDVLL